MKKTNLLLTLASSFLLASCGEGQTPIESSLSQSESSLAPESSSVIEGTPIRGDTSRTYLNNAIETSFRKNAYSMNISSLRMDALSRVYEAGALISEGLEENEYALVKTNSTEGYSIISPEAVWINTGRNASEHSLLGGYFGIKDATYLTTKNGTQETKEEHQYSNTYLKDNKYYYDYLNDKGVETPGMSEKINDLIEEIVSLIGDETTFTMGTKGYLDATDEDFVEILDMLMPKTSFAELLPMAFDAIFDNLNEVEGVTFVYEGEKIGNDKYYTTKIEITDPKAILEGARNMVNNLPDAVEDLLGEDFSIDDILEIIDEFDDSFEFTKNFDLDLTLRYTPSTFQGIDFNFAFESDGTSQTITKAPDSEHLPTADILEKVSLSGSAAFAFSDAMTINYPDFSGYGKVTIETSEQA